MIGGRCYQFLIPFKYNYTYAYGLIHSEKWHMEITSVNISVMSFIINITHYALSLQTSIRKTFAYYLICQLSQESRLP